MNAPALGGIGLLVGSMVLLTSHDATAKFLLLSMTPVMLMWCRYVFQVVATGGVIAARGNPALWRSQVLRLQMLRGALVIGSSLVAFLAMQRMPLAEFTAICCLVPVAVTCIAHFVLKQPVSRLRWLLVAGGLVGALLVVRPGGTVDTVGALLSLVVVLGYAVFQTLTGVIARRDNPLTINLYTSLVGLGVTSLAVPWMWSTSAAAAHWPLLVLAVLTGTAGQFLMVLAFARAPAATLAPYLYSAIAFSMLAGWCVFGQVPDAWALFGIVLIAGCGVSAAWVAARGVA